MRFILKLKNYVSNIAFNFIKKFLQSDSRYFYGRFYGTHNPFILLIKNLCSPKRILLKYQYGRSPLIPQIINRGKSVNDLNLSPKEIEGLNTLKKDGILVLNDFAPEIADFLHEQYNRKFTQQKSSTDASEYWAPVNQQSLELIVEPTILKIFGKYLNAVPYVRAAGAIRDCTPSFDDQTSRDQMEGSYANIWHFDTPNMIQFHLILNDITESDTHMLFANKSHLKNNCTLSNKDAFFSEEYVRKNYNLTKCIGKKGTIYMFDANGLHRMYAVKGSQRITWQVMFTPGNHNLCDLETTKVRSINNSFNIDHLSTYQKECLKFAIKT